jgi:hypothetical protein
MCSPSPRSMFPPADTRSCCRRRWRRRLAQARGPGRAMGGALASPANRTDKTQTNHGAPTPTPLPRRRGGAGQLGHGQPHHAARRHLAGDHTGTRRVDVGTSTP